jgi:hypothetical protein
MIVLDENIDEPQRRQLEMWRIRVRQIGVEVGRLGMKDLNEIIPLLHGLRRSTFFTRDRDFYEPGLAHRNYCLVYLDIEPTETAQFVRDFLRRHGFRTQAERLGKVVRVHQTGITYWQVGSSKPARARW